MTATTEAKAAEPKEIEEITEPTLKYKTWVLRVSVHCEGCRKKVTKTLKNIDGVYKIEVDMRQQKVTVTGNVEAETLIKKLTKTGKHAELWPQPNPNNNAKDKKKNKGKGKEKEQADSESPEESSHGGAAGGGGGGGGQNEKETVKVEVVQVQDSAKKNGNEGGSTSKKVDGGNSVKASEGGGAPAKAGGGGGGAPAKAGGGGGGQVKEAKAEVVRQGGNVQNQPPVVEKNGGGESDCEAENSAGGGGAGGGASGSGGKKKKKKGQKGNAANVEVDELDHCDDDDAPPNTGLRNHGNVPVGPNGPNYQHISQFPHGVYGPSGPRMPSYGPNGPSFVPASFAPAPANHGLPPQQVYEQQYPRQYYRPPVQAVNYNTAYPSYGASHYATPAPNFHSHTYAPYQGLQTELEQQYYPSQPSYGAPPRSDSLELFSDENPNGCKIM